MKTPVAITLIIMGVLLITAPIVADYLHRQQLAATMASTKSGSLSLGREMSEAARFGCWLVGAGMVVGAMLGSRSKAARAGEAP